METSCWFESGQGHQAAIRRQRLRRPLRQALGPEITSVAVLELFLFDARGEQLFDELRAFLPVEMIGCLERACGTLEQVADLIAWAPHALIQLVLRRMQQRQVRA